MSGPPKPCARTGRAWRAPEPGVAVRATLEHYRRLFLETPFFTFLRNTALVNLLGRADGRGARGGASPIVVYVFLMDYYVSGLTAGATKG